MRDVVFLALPGLQLLDLAGPLEAFRAATHCLERSGDDRPGYRITVASPRATLETATGLTLGATPLLEVGDAIDTLIVTGGADFAEREFDPALLDWIRRRAEGTRRLASVCTGAFVLAQVGALDQRSATTHWSEVERLRGRAPAARVDGAPLYTRDAGVYTSAGATAGLDLALALVEEDLGREIALAVSRMLVTTLHRPGGQAQFRGAVFPDPPAHEAIRAVRDRVVADPSADHRIPALSRHAGMSERHFIRIFTEQVGDTPGRFVRAVRVECARERLERTDDSLEEIARGCGFGSAETMRRIFQQILGVAPSAYRARVRG